MKFNTLPAAEYLDECFIYNKKNGKIYWKKRPRYHFLSNQSFINFNSKYPLKEAGNKTNDGYLTVNLNRTNKYSVHRIIFKMIYRCDPEYIIDHINGNKLDNRIENLREANDCQNSWNKSVHKNNTSGFKNIRSVRNKWRAEVTVNKKYFHLGYFVNIDQAKLAVFNFKESYHGEYLRQE